MVKKGVIMYGYSLIYGGKRRGLSRLKLVIFGHPFVGGYIRYLHIKKALKNFKFKNKKINILDAGCGGGDMGLSFLCKNNEMSITLLEKQFENLDFMKKISQHAQKDFGCKVNPVERNLLNLNEVAKYDLVLCVEVIQDIPKKMKVLKNLVHATKHGGFVIIHTSVKDWYRNSIFNKKFKIHTGYVKRWHKGRYYSLSSLEEILKDLGCKIAYKRKTFGFFGKLAWEFDQILQEKRLIRTEMLFLPVSKVLSYMDLYFESKKGTGILVVAKKV